MSSLQRRLAIWCVLALAESCGGRSGLNGWSDGLADAASGKAFGDGSSAGAKRGSGGIATGVGRGTGGFSGTPATGGRFGSGSTQGSTGDTDAGGAAGATGAGAMDTGRPPEPLPTPVTAECLTGSVRTTAESLSYDGRWFVYTDDVEVVLLDRQTGIEKSVSRSLTELDPPAVSGDGNRVLFGAGAGNQSIAYVWDRVTDGVLASFIVGDLVTGTLSYDGRFLAFYTRDAAFSDPPPYFQGGAMVVDLSNSDRWQASVNDAGEAGTDYSFASDISDDGQRVVFRSVAMNLVPGKPKRRWDVYLYDRATRTTVLAARSMTDGYADAYTYAVEISGDGRTVAFASQADDIVPGDSPDTWDVFTWDIAANAVSSPTLGHPTGAAVGLSGLSTDGRFVLFRGDADEFVETDGNGQPDAFVYDRALDRFEIVTRARDGSTLRDGGEPLALSEDGRVVAFRTKSSELAGDGGRAVTCFSVRK